LRSLKTRSGDEGQDQDQNILDFSSNDYLSLSSNERVKADAKLAIDRLGCSAGASRLMSGSLDIHARLENSLADFFQYPAALVFGSGFLTNIGVIPALAGRGDTIFADRLIHASLIDGIKLSGSGLVRYRHNDLAHLEKMLAGHDGSGRRLLVTESLFSMDGDIAPLAELRSLADRYQCLLIVDEAHAVGVFGPDGRGVMSSLDGQIRADVMIATMSKALGSYGGFVATSSEIRDLLINKARSFIYSTAPAPPCIAAALSALDILNEDPSDQLGAELLTRATEFRRMLTAGGIDTSPSCSQIVPVRVGGNELALKLAELLRADGIWTVAVRPPTVPAGSARLRLAVTLAHSDEDLARTARAVITHCRQLGIIS